MSATDAHLIDLHGRREDRSVQAPYMDEGDREIYCQEQREEDACLDHMGKAMDMVVQVAGAGVDNYLRVTVEGTLKRVAAVRVEGLDSGDGG